MPDFYIPKYNLVIEIKDGSKYPIESKAKTALKEKAVIAANMFNYIKIVDKDYSDFEDYISIRNDANYAETNDKKEYIFIIPETNEKL